MSQFGAIPAPDQTALRVGPLATRTFLTVAPAVAMMTARVDQLAFTYPLAQITIDTVALAGGVVLADIPPNADVWIGTVAGARDVFVGRARLDVTGDVVTATTLYIEEISSGSTDVPQVEYKALADDQFITILETQSLYYALPNIINVANVFTVKQDFNIVYTDQNEEPPPVANIAFTDDTMPSGFVSAATSKYRVELSGASSFQAITGAAVVSYAWNIQDGTLISGTLASAAITVDFSAGARWIELTVTDANANTHTARFPLVYYNDANQPYQVFATQDTRNKKGRTVTITGDANEMTLQDVPHGALCILWEETLQGGVASDYTIDYFVGFAIQETAALTFGNVDFSMQILGAVPFLDRIGQVPTRLEVAASPATWQEAVDDYVNTAGVMHWLLSWKLPAFLSLFDVRFFPTSGEAWAVTNQPGFGQGDLGGNNLGLVFQRLASRLPGTFGSTSSGAIILEREPQYLTSAARASWPVRADLDALTDFETIGYTRNHRPAVGQVVASGIYYRPGSGVVPFKAAAPGLAPGQGAAPAKISGLISISQVELNQVAGAHFAIVNQPFTVQALTHFPDVFEPCLRYRVAITISEADFNRPDFGEILRRFYDIPFDTGTAVTGGLTRNFYAETVAVERVGTRKLVRLTLAPELTTTPGVTLPIPQPSLRPGFGSISELPPFLFPGDIGVPVGGIPTTAAYGIPQLGIPSQPPPFPQFADYDTPFVPPGDIGMAWGWDGGDPDDSNLFITSNRFAVSPTWDDITPIVDEQVKYAVFKDGVGTEAYALTFDNVGGDSTFWYTADVFASPPVWVDTALIGEWDYIRLGAAGAYVISIGGADQPDSETSTITFDPGGYAYTVILGTVQATGGNPGGRLWDGISDPAVVVARMDLPSPSTVTSIGQDGWKNHGGGYVSQANIYDSGDNLLSNVIIDIQGNPPSNTWIPAEVTGLSVANASYIEFIVGASGSPNLQVACDNCTATYDITPALGVPTTRYSTDGVSFGVTRVVTDIPNPGGGGADASKSGAPILAGADFQTRIAVLAGDTYADEPDHPVGVTPIALFVPTLLLNNSAANPLAVDWIIASNVAEGGVPGAPTVFAVAGAAQTDISPGPDIFAVSPHCIVVNSANSLIMVAMLLKNSDLSVHLYTTTDGGATWTEGDDFGVGTFQAHIRFLPGDVSGQIFFMAGGDKGLSYSLDGGVTIVENAYPGSGTAQGYEAY